MMYRGPKQYYDIKEETSSFFEGHLGSFSRSAFPLYQVETRKLIILVVFHYSYFQKIRYILMADLFREISLFYSSLP